jgi:hypothetical protein
VATPFDFLYTNDFLNLTTEYGIQGLIIIMDSSIDAAGIYDNPVSAYLNFNMIENHHISHLK